MKARRDDGRDPLHCPCNRRSLSVTTAEEHPAAAGPAAASGSAAPEAWRDARSEAARLARRLQYLTWPDRARALDEFLWERARLALSSEEVTAVINRQIQGHAQADRVAAYARYCSAVLTAMLAALAEAGPVGGAPQALTFLLSQKDEHREAAVGWIAATAATAILRAELTKLPGFAFMLLTLYPNDSAESFMARDAFWTAMLGNC
jgi:hypothetical protein